MKAKKKPLPICKHCGATSTWLNGAACESCEARMIAECGCADRGMAPSHTGSASCESGSIASGGTNSHCSCDTCF
jgi:hypothetical protein